MAHDAFISYSSKDKTVADAVCAKLESQKIRCWIAPRDVPAGQTWASAIVNAIRTSRVLVLVLSEGSNNSAQVIREVEQAVDNAIPIIPFRIENVEPSDEMRYFIKSIHWLDAMNPPLERDLHKLSESVDALLSVGREEQPPAIESFVSAPVKEHKPFPVWAITLIGLSVLIILGVGGLWFVPRLNSPLSSPSPTTAVPASNPTDIQTSEIIQSTKVPSEPIWSEWQPITFTVPEPNLWDLSEKDHYYALEQTSSDAFAWSTETFEGDLQLSFNIEGTESGQTDACVSLYGNGYGSLIFCVQSDVYLAEKHTHYHEGENWLSQTSSGINLNEGVYSTMIEIVGNKATMYVNGDRVLYTQFDKDEIDNSGRIGLFKPWYTKGMIFSNVRIKTRVE